MAGLNADELAISTASGGSSKWGAGRGRPFKWDQARRLFGRYAALAALMLRCLRFHPLAE